MDEYTRNRLDAIDAELNAIGDYIENQQKFNEQVLLILKDVDLRKELSPRGESNEK